VQIRSLDGAGWEWGLALAGWGRPDDLLDQRVVDLQVDGERIELDRGALTEWFINTSDGLEHGFTVPARPHGAGERVVFDLAFAGGLHPVFAEDGQAVDLYSTDNVAVLRYGKLIVIDAVGEEVPARLEPIPGGVRIAVEDGLAVYPLTIDPLATSAAWTALGQARATTSGTRWPRRGTSTETGTRRARGGVRQHFEYGPDVPVPGRRERAGGHGGVDQVGRGLRQPVRCGGGTRGDVNGDGYST